MNEFTKEELEEIHDGLGWKIDRGQWTPLTNELFHRTKSMIDNYCTHTETVCTGGFCYKCVQCDMRFGDETQ